MATKDICTVEQLDNSTDITNIIIDESGNLRKVNLKKAVNNFTPPQEKIEQIQQNTNDIAWMRGDISDLKTQVGSLSEENTELKDKIGNLVSKKQGTENSGKALIVDENGNVICGEAGVSADATLSEEGKAADAKATGDAISELKGDLDDYSIGDETGETGQILTRTATGAEWGDAPAVDISDNSITHPKMMGLSYEGEEKPIENVTNIFDKNTMVLDGYIYNLSGFASQNGGKCAKIPIVSGKTYAFWANEKPWKYLDMGGIYIYADADNQLCKFFIGASNTDMNGTGMVMNTDTSARGYTFTAPEGAAYLCFTVRWGGGTDYTDVVMVEEGNTCHDYVEYSKDGDDTSKTDLTGCEITKLFNAKLRDSFAREKIKELEKEIKPTPTTSMKWTVLGDSISVNTSHTDTFYHDILAEEFGLNVVNMAQSGSGFPLLVSNVCPNIPTDTDIITIMMGTNDIDRELGTLEGKTGMYGTLYDTAQYIVKNFPNAKFGMITPVPRGDNTENYTKLRNLAMAIKEVCDALSVPCFYLTGGSGMYPQFSECRANMYSADGVHPNKNGQKRMASAMRYWFKALIEY